LIVIVVCGAEVDMYAGASVCRVSVSERGYVSSRRSMDHLKIAYVLELFWLNRLHGLALGSLAANDFEGDVYIPARRVRIGTNLGVGLLDELLEFLLRKGLIFDAHADG
jgi:hypothetical protein